MRMRPNLLAKSIASAKGNIVMPSFWNELVPGRHYRSVDLFTENFWEFMNKGVRSGTNTKRK